MKKVILLLLVFSIVQTGFSQQKRVLTLQEVIDLAQINSRQARQNETSFALTYWSYRVYKSNFNPSLNLQGTVPDFSRSFEPVQQDDGTFDFVSVDQSNSNLELGLSQSIPWTNGIISVNTTLARFDNFDPGPNQQELRYSGVPLNVRLIQPLFAVNPFKWDRKIEPLNYEEGKREYAQTKEAVAREAARRFFDLLTAQVDLQIAEQNYSKNDTVFKIEQGRYNIGTTTEDQLLQTEINLLNSERDAQQAELDVQNTSLDLRTYTGLGNEVDIELALPENLPTLLLDLPVALDYAKANRAEFIGFERRRLEAQRSVAEARAGRFDANLFASFGYNNQGLSISDVYNNPDAQSRIRLGFNLPILDGGRNKARMRTAMARQQLTEFQVEQDSINFAQEISTAVRNFGQIRNAIDIAKKGEEIAQKRFEISNNRYLIGKIDILQYTTALNDKDAAQKGYINSLRQYWDAFYQMRQLTLYDFLFNRPLYNPLLEYDPMTAGR